MRILPIPFSDPMVAALLAGRKTQTRRILDPQPFPSQYFIPPLYSEPMPQKDGTMVVRFSAAAIGGGAFVEDTIEARYAVGDLLYVRETYYQFGHWEPVPGATTKGGKQKWGFVPDDPAVCFEMLDPYYKAMYRADPTTPAWHKRLGRFMPRAASRLTLIVEGVKVERLQDISEADALAEGIIYANVITDMKCYGGAPIEETADRYWNGAEPDEFEGHECAVDAFADLWGVINGPDAWDANPWVAAYSFRLVPENVDRVAA